MGLFSKKKEKLEKSTNFLDAENGVKNRLPGSLPDTMMQRINVSQMQKDNSTRKELQKEPQYTKDLKSPLQAKDEYKRIPHDYLAELSKDKGPERHEIEQVVMLKSGQQPQQIRKEEKEEEILSRRSLPSFFVELERRLLGHKKGTRNLLNQDLMVRMKEYHDSIHKGDAFFLHEGEIEEEIARSIDVLKDLESDWLLTKRQVASAEKVLSDREQEMEKRLMEFKNLVAASEKFKAYHMVAPVDQAFLLVDGGKLLSIQHLVAELPRMKDETFIFHVDGQRNDFANWIRDVFKLEELALKVSSAKSKEELMEILRTH